MLSLRDEIYLSAFSPPSPVFDFPPILFMAMAKVVWASMEMLPKDMAPVANLLTISEAGSTWNLDENEFQFLLVTFNNGLELFFLVYTFFVYMFNKETLDKERENIN